MHKSEPKQNRTLNWLAVSLLVGLWVVTPGWVNALPSVGEIVSGTGSIEQPSVQDLVIQQDSQRLITNGQGVSIGSARDIDVIAPNISADESSFNETRDLILKGNRVGSLPQPPSLDTNSIVQGSLGTFLNDFFQNGGPGC